uniref:Uncharacterized protein n=1 Tax=Candidatus Methanogaster sp. ANME-2c ERB4 TaxID=2759911 RepID=A0A7G9YR72_9EURY|nr:hypothetical protein EGLMOMJH_00045 [Methanosarcinales archaeon ANME-2c ERB4]
MGAVAPVGADSLLAVEYVYVGCVPLCYVCIAENSAIIAIAVLLLTGHV